MYLERNVNTVYVMHIHWDRKFSISTFPVIPLPNGSWVSISLWTEMKNISTHVWSSESEYVYKYILIREIYTVLAETHNLLKTI